MTRCAKSGSVEHFARKPICEQFIKVKSNLKDIEAEGVPKEPETSGEVSDSKIDFCDNLIIFLYFTVLKCY